MSNVRDLGERIYASLVETGRPIPHPDDHEAWSEVYEILGREALIQTNPQNYDNWPQWKKDYALTKYSKGEDDNDGNN